MPAKLPRNQRKSEIVAFRVTKGVFREWNNLKKKHVGFECEFQSLQDLLVAMMYAFKKSLKPRVVSR